VREKELVDSCERSHLRGMFPAPPSVGLHQRRRSSRPYRRGRRARCVLRLLIAKNIFGSAPSLPACPLDRDHANVVIELLARSEAADLIDNGREKLLDRESG
jgi:hypothetical protein